MAVIFRGLRSKLPVTIRTVGFGLGNLREQAALWLRLTARHWGAGVVVMCFQAPLRARSPCKVARQDGDGGWSVVSLEVIELVHQSCAHGSS